MSWIAAAAVVAMVIAVFAQTPSIEKAVSFDLRSLYHSEAFSFDVIINTTSPQDVIFRDLFFLNGTVTCRQGACENVTVRLRYNATQPNEPSSTVLESGSPFYVKQTPYVCGYLNQDQSCSPSFVVNATGLLRQTYALDFFAQSNLSDTSVQTRKVTSCWDTDGQCTSSNLVLDDNVYESVNLKTGGFGIINATAFNNSVTDGAFIESANITVIWKTDVGVGAGNLYVEYQYDGTWNVCAGPLGEQSLEVTTICGVSSLNGTELNALEVRLRGNDTDGALAAFLEVDYMSIKVNSSAKNDSSNLRANIINSYNVYYGNASGNITVSDNSGSSIYTFPVSTTSGTLYVTDTDSVVSFANMRALGVMINGSNSTADFTEVDGALNMSGAVDSVNATWSRDGSRGLNVTSYMGKLATYDNLPVAKSEYNSTFWTGILWDITDDGGNGQYDSTDEEDLVFLVPLKDQGAGGYAAADFEIKVPYLLKMYKGSTNTVSFYLELT